jgi:flagellar hook protein FlgE
MYAAISGLKAHMNKLNVIGNNIANVNTNGYKSGRALFQTELYTTMKTGSNGTTTIGGTNPSQIGYGATVGSIDIDMSTGTYSPTGKATDCMIDGDGFFVLGDKTLTFDTADSLKSLTLSRVGDFEFKADGYLSDGQGSVVYGFLTTEQAAAGNGANAGATTLAVGDTLVPIGLPKLRTTDNVPVLDANGNQMQDANGNDITTTTYEIVYPGAADYAQLPFAQMDSITIDGKTGKITGTSKDTDEIITIGYIAIGNVTNPNGVTQESGSYYKAGEGAGDLTITLLGGVASDIGLTYINATANNAANGAAGGQQDEGLRILSGGTTQLITGGLEASKTDLATEISEMITTQRGYQANTRIITVTDSMLEELVNIKR